MIFSILNIIIGLYLSILINSLTTQNFKSALVYKILPYMFSVWLMLKGVLDIAVMIK